MGGMRGVGGMWGVMEWRGDGGDVRGDGGVRGGGDVGGNGG